MHHGGLLQHNYVDGFLVATLRIINIFRPKSSKSLELFKFLSVTNQLTRINKSIRWKFLVHFKYLREKRDEIT